MVKNIQFSLPQENIQVKFVYENEDLLLLTALTSTRVR